MSTRYYIEKETAIPGEWKRDEEFWHVDYSQAQAEANSFVDEYQHAGNPTKFRIIQIMENVIGIYPPPSDEGS